MLDIFLATLNPMLILFFCIAIGFLLKIFNIVPENTGKIIAKLVLWVFAPALSFSSMAKSFNINSIGTYFINMLISTFAVLVAIFLAIFLSKFFVKKDVYERKVYQYALAFGNMGYVGDPLVLALFGLEGLAYYKITTLPITIAIYIWGLNVLVPNDTQKKNALKGLINPPIISMLIGMLVGITGLGGILYSTDNFFVNLLSDLGTCMGPLAMILAGFTIGSYNIKKMLLNKKVYIASLLRLIIIPSFMCALLFGAKELINFLFALNITNTPIIILFIAFSTPLGLNTVVFPEAYGGDPSTGASMAMISHTLCVLTIPIMYALIILLLGPAPIF